MTGTNTNQLQQDKYMANPFTLIKDSTDIGGTQSIIDQLLSLQEVGNKSTKQQHQSNSSSSSSSSRFNSFNVNGTDILISLDYLFEDEQNKLNNSVNVRKLRKNLGNIINDTSNLDEIFYSMTRNKQDIVIAYDDTIAKFKLIFDETSSQMQRIYSKINTLIGDVTSSLDNNTLFVIMGEEMKLSSNINEEEEEAEENKAEEIEDKQGDLVKSFCGGDSFFFAYSKGGFVKGQFLEEIETAWGRRKKIRQVFGEDITQIDINDQNIDKSKDKIYSGKNNREQLYIHQNAIASTLALAIGLEIPALNFGRNILDILSLNKEDEEKQDYSIFFSHLFKNSYKTLSQQIDLFTSLQNGYDFFPLESQSIIDQKYFQIKDQKEKAASSLQTLGILSRDISEYSIKNSKEQLPSMPDSSYLKNVVSIKQVEREKIQSYLIAHLAQIVELQELVAMQLDGKKNISLSVTITYILFYIICFIFSLRYLLRQMYSILDSYRERVTPITKQLSLFLPLSVLGYFFFSFYSAEELNDQVVFICIVVSASIFLIELLFHSNKLHFSKLLLIISVLYISFDLMSSGGLATIGFACHVILRLRFGSVYKNYDQLNNQLFAILITILSFYRLLSFDSNAYIIDSIQLLIVFKNKHIQTYDKICFILLIVTQYFYNFTYNQDDQIGSYLIYGCALFTLVMIIELYETISLALSFNKFFITNIIFTYFLNILINIRQPYTWIEQFVCCAIFYLPSFLIIILMENTTSSSFQSCIFQFSPKENHAQTTFLIPIKEEKQMIDNQGNEGVEKQEKYINKQQEEKRNQLDDQKLEDIESFCTVNRNKVDQKYEIYQIDENLKVSECEKINAYLISQKDTIQKESIQQEYAQSKDLKDSSIIIKQTNQSLQNVISCINTKNFGVYTMIGVLQLIFTLITFSQIFSDQYTLNPSQISQSKQGLIQYSVFQYLIATFCIAISSKIKNYNNKIKRIDQINNTQQIIKS